MHKMDLPVCKITWILLLTVGFNHFNGISATCNPYYYETPFAPMCEAGELSMDAIYIDLSGAPEFTKVECACDFTFSDIGTAIVRYRVENETISDCPVKLKINLGGLDINAGCESLWNLEFPVGSFRHTVTYTKTSSSISNWDACFGIELVAADNIGVNVTCYPYILLSEQGSSTTALTEQTSITKQPLTEKTTSNQTSMALKPNGINNQQISSNILGPIVGGVIGGVALLALVVLATCFLMRRTKTGENSLAQGKNADFVATLERGGNDNVQYRGIGLSVTTKAEQITQNKEDIFPYDYIEDPYDYIDGRLVRNAKVEVTVLKPSISPSTTKPAVPPREDASGYLQPAKRTKVQYADLASDIEKTDKGENQYIILPPAEETNANDYLHPRTDDYLHPKAYDYLHTKADDYQHTKTDNNLHTMDDDYLHPKADDYLHPKTDDYLHPKADNNLHTKADDYLHPKADDNLHTKDDDYLHPKANDYQHIKTDKNLHTKANDYLHTKADEYQHIKTDENLHTKAEDYLHPKDDDYLHSKADEYLHNKVDDSLHIKAGDNLCHGTNLVPIWREDV